MDQAASGFSIDWRLLLLQASNFLLLLAILTWLLWKPLIRLLDDRRRTIAEGLSAAEAQKRSRAEFEAQRTKLVAVAQAEARDLLVKTRAQAQAERAALRAELKAERREAADRASRDLAGLRERTLAEARAQLSLLVIDAAAKIIAQPNAQAALTKRAANQALKELP